MSRYGIEILFEHEFIEPRDKDQEEILPLLVVIRGEFQAGLGVSWHYDIEICEHAYSDDISNIIKFFNPGAYEAIKDICEEKVQEHVADCIKEWELKIS